MNKEHCTPVVKKRGRKSKKELEEIALQKASTDNINVFIEELNNETEINMILYMTQMMIIIEDMLEFLLKK